MERARGEDGRSGSRGSLGGKGVQDEGTRGTRGLPCPSQVCRVSLSLLITSLKDAQTDDCLRQFASKLVEDNPDDPPVAYYYKSLAHYHIGELDDAEKSANEASALAEIRKIDGLECVRRLASPGQRRSFRL